MGGASHAAGRAGKPVAAAAVDLTPADCAALERAFPLGPGTGGLPII